MLYGHSPITDIDSGVYNFDLNKLEYILSTAQKFNLKFLRYEDLISD